MIQASVLDMLPTNDLGLSEGLSGRLVDCLYDRADREQIAFLTRFGIKKTLTGRDLYSAALFWNARWRDTLGPGSHVLVLALSPGETFIVALLAGLIGGHTVVPVAPPRAGTRSDRMLYIMRDCEPTAVICAPGNRDIILRHLTHDGTSAPICPDFVMETTQDMFGGAWPAQRPGQSDCSAAIIQYTSGSTRMPKGVRIMGQHILANCDLVSNAWGLSASDRVVNWLPHYHDMGLMGGILYPLLRGSYSVQLNPLDMVRSPAFWLKAISDCQGTFSGGPAFAFADCLKRITDEDCEGLDLSTWRRAFCGAEPIQTGLLQAFSSRFMHWGLPPRSVFGCYGMAEMTLFVAGAPETTEPPRSDVLKVHPCTLTDAMRPNIRIVDSESCTEHPDGEQGEIWLRGPSKGSGYVNLPEETEATFNNMISGQHETGWLRTGDLGVITSSYLYVTGRLKDVLIANGRKISASELEWLAAQQDDALNPLAAAAFMPDPNENAAAVLLIELKAGSIAPADLQGVRSAIEQAVKGEWGIHLSEIRILPRGSLERTSSGKVRRQHIAGVYRQGGFSVLLEERSAQVVPA